MRNLGLGISNEDLGKIKGEGNEQGDEKFAKALAGKILLQVQDAGQAWYIWPKNNQRYYLGSPDDALRVLRELGLGISDTNLKILNVSDDYKQSEQNLYLASQAVRIGEDNSVLEAITAGSLGKITNGILKVYSFNLLSPLSTQEYGYLGKGAYFYSMDAGLMDAKTYYASSEYKILEADEDSKLIIAEIQKLQTALEQYKLDVGGYPVSGNELIMVGGKGRNVLSKSHGFWGTTEDPEIYIQMNFPAIYGHNYSYHSRDGQHYTLTFNIPGSAYGFESSKLVANGESGIGYWDI